MTVYVYIVVPDLPVCVDQRGAPQCCSIRYILARLNTSEEDFLEGLRTELRERFQDFETIVTRIRECKLIHATVEVYM